MAYSLTNISELPLERLIELLHTGKVVTHYHVDDLLMRYEFSAEMGDGEEIYIMRLRGLVGEEAQKVTAKDFTSLLVAVTLNEASYEPDPKKYREYEVWKERASERDTEALRAISATLNESVG